MSHPPIAGVLPVIHTPFLANGSIDYDGLAREVDWVYEAGAHGVVLAMASNLLRLTHEERLDLTARLPTWSRGRGAVIISVGAESCEQAVAYARAAEAAGADGVMAIPPIANRLPEAGIDRYYRAIADAISLPVVVQDASGYVGRPMSIELQSGLLHAYGPDKIIFKPESYPLGSTISALRDATQGQARMLEGTGGMCLVDAYRRGIVGTMPGSDVIDAIVALWNALEAGDEARIYEIAMPLTTLMALVTQGGLDGFLNTELHILHRRGIIASPRAREPHSNWPDAETTAELDRLVDLLLAVL